MFVQIVTYNLNGVSEEAYIDIAHQVAPQFASMGGLLAKVWLQNSGSNSYGAVYFWEDRESQERFVASDFFEGTYPGFANVVSQGFEVFEHLTRATQPMMDILEEEAGWAPPPPPAQGTAHATEVVDDELVEEAELLDEPEPADELPLVEELDEAAPAPVIRATRKVVKKTPKKAATKVAKGTKKARPAKVVKVTKKAVRPRRPAATRVTKVTKVTKKKAARPTKVASKRAKRLS